MSLQQLAEGQDSPEVPINENFETLEHQAVYGQRQPAHSGLTWGYYGGRWGGFSVSNGTLSLTASSDNYVVVAIATGVISVSTASTNWDNDTDYVRVYKITTGTSGPSAIEDHRAGPGGVHGGGGGSSGGVSDGDKGDVTVSGTGATWTIDDNVVSFAKLQDVTANSVVARAAATDGDASAVALAASQLLGRGSSGDVAAITLGTGLTMTGTTLSAPGGGGGSGTKTYAVLTPMTSCPPSSAFATLDTRNSIPVLDFDDTTEESAFWVSVMPEGASLGSGLKVTIYWMATTATSGNVRWGVQFERMNTDEDSDSFDTATEANAATSGTSGIITATTITCTTIDSIAAQDVYRIKVYRDSGDTTNDTVAGDAELVAVQIWSAA